MHIVPCVCVAGVTYALGRKEYGRLGLGEDCDDAKELIPISALRDKKCVDISCGSAVSFAVTDKGEREQSYKADIILLKSRHCHKYDYGIILNSE
jgi:alpha-tubulin suppressor-like RCC1 family protein